MSLFENITKKVSNTAKAAAKKSSDLVEVTKLNMSISTEEGKIQSTYGEIGKTVYEAYTKGEDIPEAFKELCDKIKSYEDNIKDLKEKILLLKNTKACPSCGTELEVEIAFCPNCGTKQEIPSPVQEEEAEPAEKVCPACSTSNPAEAAFCCKCGNKL